MWTRWGVEAIAFGLAALTVCSAAQPHDHGDERPLLACIASEWGQCVAVRDVRKSCLRGAGVVRERSVSFCANLTCTVLACAVVQVCRSWQGGVGGTCVRSGARFLPGGAACVRRTIAKTRVYTFAS